MASSARGSIESRTAPRVVLRPMQPRDVAEIARLCSQLGYPASHSEVAGRFTWLASSANDEVVVALVRDQIVGWIHLHVGRTLECDAHVEIGGLVVDEQHRGRGVGRLLMTEAERYAGERGCSRLRLRSNVTRAGAHSFYGKLGYRIVKTQHAFEKTLGPK